MKAILLSVVLGLSVAAEPRYSEAPFAFCLEWAAKRSEKYGYDINFYAKAFYVDYLKCTQLFLEPAPWCVAYSCAPYEPREI